MTSLPKLPTNFDAAETKTAEDIEKAQKELEEAQRKVEELLAKIQSYSQQAENINLNLSIGAKLKDGIVKNTVDPLFNFGCVNLELPILQLSLLTNLYLLSIRVPTIPAIPDALKLALGIRVNIPIELPTIAEFKQYINLKIEESKQKCQQQIIDKQLTEAQDEETPFTARQLDKNNRDKLLSPVKSCITTETGKTEEEALEKAEFMLKRVLKCCECCGNAGLQILSSKQENGVFIVTAGILES